MDRLFPTGNFPDTKSSLLGQAIGGDMEALSALVTKYGPAIETLVNRMWRGRPDKAAKDLVQDVLGAICAPGRLATWDGDKGKFRSWICGIVRNTVNEASRRENAAKRGGKLERLGGEAIDWVASDAPSPEAAFDHAWAKIVLESAKSTVRTMWDSKGKADIFVELLPSAMQARGAHRTQAELAMELGRPENTVAGWVKQLRDEIREACLSEVMQTCADSDEAREEMRHLMECLRAPKKKAKDRPAH